MSYSKIATFYRETMGVKNERTVTLLAENTRFIHRPKGFPLRIAGEPMTTVVFHLDGVGKAYVIDDKGQEHVMGFCYKPGGPCLGAAGISERITLNIDTVTEMDTLELKVSALQKAMKQDPDVGTIVQKLMAEDHNTDYQWQIAIKSKFGEDRYKWFLENYSDLVGVVTQKDIASFLSLRPQSLSRIKVALEKKQKPD